MGVDRILGYYKGNEVKLQEINGEMSRLNAQLDARGSENERLLKTLDETRKEASITHARLSLEVEDLQSQVVCLQERCVENDKVRRQLHNTIAELKGNIRVFCRVRPFVSSIDGTEQSTPFSFEENDPYVKPRLNGTNI